jgi:hypothetical protein
MKLIVNADDFGLTSGVNNAVVECYLAGSLSSATLMVNTSAFDEAVEMAKANTGLGVGLHFNLTLGRPLSNLHEISSLVMSDGIFYPRAICEKQLIMGRINSDHIRREFQAQVDKFNASGLKMTHIDSHQHIHIFPKVFDVVAEFCACNELPLRIPWVWKGKGRNVSIKKRLRSAMLNFLIIRNLRKWAGKIITNMNFASVFDLTNMPEEIGPDIYLRILNETREFPLEIMVHPAYEDNELKTLTQISVISDRERRVLTGMDMKKEMEKRGLLMVSYKEAFLD